MADLLDPADPFAVPRSCWQELREDVSDPEFLAILLEDLHHPQILATFLEWVAQDAELRTAFLTATKPGCLDELERRLAAVAHQVLSPEQLIALAQVHDERRANKP